MKRRGFLRGGLTGAALLALGGAGLALYPTRRIATRPDSLAVLDDKAFQAMVAIAARVLPPDADTVKIAVDVDHALGFAPVEAQSDLRNVLHLFENALPGLLLDGRAKPFTQLDGDAQDRALMAWRDSRLAIRRGAYHALRKLALSAYYMRESAWSRLHYGGPPSPNFRLDDSTAGTAAWIAEHGDQ